MYALPPSLFGVKINVRKSFKVQYLSFSSFSRGIIIWELVILYSVPPGFVNEDWLCRFLVYKTRQAGIKAPLNLSIVPQGCH